MEATVKDLGARMVPAQTAPLLSMFQYGAAASLVSGLGRLFLGSARTNRTPFRTTNSSAGCGKLSGVERADPFDGERGVRIGQGGAVINEFAFDQVEFHDVSLLLCRLTELVKFCDTILEKACRLPRTGFWTARGAGVSLVVLSGTVWL